MQLQSNRLKKSSDSVFKSYQTTINVPRNIFRGIELTKSVQLMI